MRELQMHQTPNIPGTSPVTDNPNPGGTQGTDPTGPRTDPDPEPEPGEDVIPGMPPSKKAVSHERDYGGLYETGGTAANKGTIDPHATTKGTENESSENGR